MHSVPAINDTRFRGQDKITPRMPASLPRVLVHLLMSGTVLHCLLIITVLLLSFSTIIQYTPLIVSSGKGHSQVVRFLLSQPEIDINASDEVC